MAVGVQHPSCFPVGQTLPAHVYWRESIIRSQFGLDCKLLAGRRFEATLRRWDLGGVRLAHMTLEGHSVLSERKIAPRFAHEHLYLKVVAEGKVSFDQCGETVCLGSGAMAIVDPLREFCEAFLAPTKLILFMLPRRELRERGLAAGVDRPIVQDTSCAEGKLLWRLLVDIAEHVDNTATPFRERLGSQVMDLADVLVGMANKPTGSRTAIAACYRIKGYLKQHLGDCTLSTAAVAAAVRLSPRYINRLFAAEGTSLMRYLWTCRLERAHEMLDSAGEAGARIEEVAWRCGFADSSHFSRSFKSRYGCSPREFRRAGRPIGTCGQVEP